MDEPVPRTLALAHRIVALVRSANVSEVEASHALHTAKAILGCYLDRPSLPAELEDREIFGRPELPQPS